MAQKCCTCRNPVVNGTGFTVMGYRYHDYCFPIIECEEKQRCYYCHKIIRKGDQCVSLGDLGIGGNDDRVCAKCTNKHFAAGKD